MIRNYFRITWILFFSIAFHDSEAQNNNQDYSKSTDILIGQYIKSDDLGAAVLISKNGKILYHRAFGMASMELDVPLDIKHIFRIASMTKQFISVSILVLEEKGLLNRKDNINKYLPDFPTQGQTITIENLMTHTSGIKNLTSIDGYLDFMVKKVSKDELIGFFKDKELEFEPGTKHSYSNSGYILLEKIIETVSEKNLDEFLQESIFKPLDMKSSSQDIDGRIVKNRLPGYLNKNTAMDWMSMTQIACIQMTVEDMYKWHSGLRAGKLISKANLEQAQKPYILKNGTAIGYGYGWTIKDFNNVRFIEHGGGISGFGGYEIYYPKEDLFAVMFSNSQSVQEDLILNKIINIWTDGKSMLRDLPVTETQLKTFEGKYAFGKIITQVVVETNKLYLQGRYNNSKWEMHCINDNQFYIDEQYPFIYTFIKNSNGRIDRMEVKGRGDYLEVANKTK